MPQAPVLRSTLINSGYRMRQIDNLLSQLWAHKGHIKKTFKERNPKKKEYDTNIKPT